MMGCGRRLVKYLVSSDGVQSPTSTRSNTLRLGHSGVRTPNPARVGLGLVLLLALSAVALQACGTAAQSTLDVPSGSVNQPAFPKEEGEATPEPRAGPTPEPTHCFDVVWEEGGAKALCPHTFVIYPTPEGGVPPVTKYPKPGVAYPKLGSGLESEVKEAEERALAATGRSDYGAEGANESDESTSEDYIEVDVNLVSALTGEDWETKDREGLIDWIESNGGEVTSEDQYTISVWFPLVYLGNLSEQDAVMEVTRVWGVRR